jgi:hypothetical protein
MTQLAVSFILANDFGCNIGTMVPWTCCSQRGEMSSLKRVRFMLYLSSLKRVRFMLYLPDIGLLSGH